jgi:hypothetical protein
MAFCMIADFAGEIFKHTFFAPGSLGRLFQDNGQRVAGDLRAFGGTLFGECLASCGSAGENPNPLLLIECQTLQSVFSQTRPWSIPVDQK